MKRNYRIQTYQLRDGSWAAAWTKLAPHQYPKSSAYGERTVMKAVKWRDVPEHFKDRKSALEGAARDAKKAGVV